MSSRLISDILVSDIAALGVEWEHGGIEGMEALDVAVLKQLPPEGREAIRAAAVTQNNIFNLARWCVGMLGDVRAIESQIQSVLSVSSEWQKIKVALRETFVDGEQAEFWKGSPISAAVRRLFENAI